MSFELEVPQNRDEAVAMIESRSFELERIAKGYELGFLAHLLSIAKLAAMEEADPCAVFEDICLQD